MATGNDDRLEHADVDCSRSAADDRLERVGGNAVLIVPNVGDVPETEFVAQ